MLEINQKKGIERRSYRVNADYVEVDFKTIKEKFKYKVHLTEIGNQIQYEADNLLIGKLFFFISVLITLICVGVYFFGEPKNPGTYIFNIILWSIISLAAFISPSKDDIIIVNGEKYIRLFRTKPNQIVVIKFAEELIEMANQKKIEMAINFDLNEEQFLSNIAWLLNTKLISKTKADELREEYKIKKLL